MCKYDFSNGKNQDSDVTYIYDSSFVNSQSTDSFKIEYFNQIENGDGKIVIYYTNCDSVLNKREELELEIENFDPDVVVLTEIFQKSQFDRYFESGVEDRGL